MICPRMSSLRIYYQSYSLYRDKRALSAARAWLPLAYDTAIFVLTTWCTLPSIRNREIGRIKPTLLFDGALYYMCVYPSVSNHPLNPLTD